MATATRDEIQTATRAIQAANQEFMTACERRDVGVLGRLYSDDALVLPPNSDIVRGTGAIGEFWQGMFDRGVTAVNLETVDVEPAGDAAVEVGRYRVMAGEALADHGKYLVVWKKQAGEWKLHRDIWNTSQPPVQQA